jgi:hypothetical protein
MTVQAKVLRDFTLGDEDLKKGDVKGVPASQFHDLESVGLVERAPKEPDAPAPAPKRAPRRDKAAK